MPYIERFDNNKIKGVHARLQPGIAEEFLEEDGAEYLQHLADKQGIVDALNAQIQSERANLPTWSQVVTAINNAFPDTAQANIIKKIARPVYTSLKKSVT